MKTSVMEVHDMLSVLSVDEVEKRIGEVPGVASVTVNFAAGNATVRFDETRLEHADIKSAVRQRGFESATPTAAPTGGGGHQGHAAAGAPPATAAPIAPTDRPAAPTAASTLPPPPVKVGAPATLVASPAEPPAAPTAAAGDDPKNKAAPEKI